MKINWQYFIVGAFVLILLLMLAFQLAGEF